MKSIDIKMNRFALLIATAVVAGQQPIAGAAEPANVEVRLLAHHWPTATFSLTHSGLRNLFIARIERGDGDLRKGRVVLLDYLHNSPEPPRIGELLSWDGTWRISLTRQPECDADTSSLTSVDSVNADTGERADPLPALQLLPGGIGVAIPRDERFPCYTFGPEGLAKTAEP